jgi:hypothetical protein
MNIVLAKLVHISNIKGKKLILREECGYRRFSTTTTQSYKLSLQHHIYVNSFYHDKIKGLMNNILSLVSFLS